MKFIQGLFSGLLARLATLGRAAAAWRWGSPLARAAAAALGLVVLAAIGRSALAGGSSTAHEVSVEPLPPEPVARAPSAQAPALSVAAITSASSEPVPSPAPPLDAGPVAPIGRATPDDPVFLNQATVADLRRLPGVGAKKAQAILTLRDRLQHFRQIEDLLKVKGIGRASLKKLRPLVRLDLLASPPDAGATPPPPSPD